MPGLVNLTGLQDALCDEIKEILQDVQTVNVSGETVHGFSVYAQQLPKVEAPMLEKLPQAYRRDPDAPFFPYALVMCQGREAGEIDEKWAVHMRVLLAIHDSNRDNQGHRRLIPMLERVSDRFLRKPLLGSYWTARPEIDQYLQQEDYWPYFFGVTDITFDMHKQCREDPIDDGFKFREEIRGAGPFAGSRIKV